MENILFQILSEICTLLFVPYGMYCIYTFQFFQISVLLFFPSIVIYIKNMRTHYDLISEDFCCIAPVVYMTKFSEAHLNCFWVWKI